MMQFSRALPIFAKSSSYPVLCRLGAGGQRQAPVRLSTTPCALTSARIILGQMGAMVLLSPCCYNTLARLWLVEKRHG